MPYHLMTDEFIRDRLAAGEAQRLAAAPGEVVQYDGARWMRSGEVWVLEDPARARFELAPAGSVSDDADTVDVYLTAAQAASAGTEPVQARSAAAAELPPGAPVAALPAGPAEPPAEAHATGIAGRGHRRRWVFTGAACVAALAAVAVAAVTSGDRTQSAAFRPVVTPVPSVIETAPDGPDGSGPTGSRLEQPPASPPVGEEASVPAAPRTRLIPEQPVPSARPPSAVPSPPPVQPTPPAATSPAPPKQPHTPEAAVANLEDTVKLVWQAGQLSDKGRAELLTGVGRIKKAVSNSGEKQIRKQINKFLRNKTDIRNRGELTVAGEDRIEDAVDLLKRTL